MADEGSSSGEEGEGEGELSGEKAKATSGRIDRRKGGVSNMSALCHLVEELRELGHIVEITCIDGNEMRNGKSTIPYN